MTAPDDDLVEGDRIELTVGAPAHGGHCVARLGEEHGRVVFVRHALPGERITAEITEVHRGYLRADAVTIHEASPDRVEPPCPWAHPGGCGGCDLQHVAGDAQLRWKGAVVTEQLRRLAGLGDHPVRVEALPTATTRTRPDDQSPPPLSDDASPEPGRPAPVTPASAEPAQSAPAGASPAAPDSAAAASAEPESAGAARAELDSAGASPVDPDSAGAASAESEAAGAARAELDSADALPAAPDSAGAVSAEPDFDGAGPAEAGADRLLGWRSRVRYAVDAAGRPGLLQHRSHQVVPIDRCRIAHPAVQQLDLLSREWPTADALEAVASTGGDVASVAHPSGAGVLPADDLIDGPALGSGDRIPLDGPAEVTEIAAGRRWTVPLDGFWQVHPAAAETLTATVLELLEPAAGEISWDLYGGAGLFAAALAERTGARTTLVESSPVGVAAARNNLADLPVEVVSARVDMALRRRRITAPVDLIVLDPPRSGAGAQVVRALAGTGARAIAYVACDPAALARDVATFRGLGWELAELRAFDLFPMTQHVECVALLKPAA